MHNIKHILITLFLIAISINSISAVDITGINNISTSDETPTIDFIVTGNNSSYICNLYIDGIARGVDTADNATDSSITCNSTLVSGTTYTYYITAYNTSEMPNLTTSDSYSIEISTFGGIVTMLCDIVSVFGGLVDLIIGVAPFLIAMSMISFVLILISSVVALANKQFKD